LWKTIPHHAGTKLVIRSIHSNKQDLFIRNYRMKDAPNSLGLNKPALAWFFAPRNVENTPDLS